MSDDRQRSARRVAHRARRELWRARHGATRRVTAAEPGELVCLDTFYIGNLKGVGKVWQITVCDAASSYGVAAILPALTSAAAAAFLRESLAPLFRKAGWLLQRVLTDGGPEFKRAFDEACAALGIRHTRTKPRHAWTNGFVERLQQTILHEHWRITSAGTTSPAARSCTARCSSSCGSTTLSDPTTATGLAAARRPLSYSVSARSLAEFMTNQSGTVKASTPTRAWTRRASCCRFETPNRISNATQGTRSDVKS
jgi:transposase InsO family protein